MTDRSAAWYAAVGADPVNVRTPFLALKLPVIPLRLVNPRKSWPAVKPALMRAVAPVSVADPGERTVRLAAT